ncbi:NF X1 type zinc finger protein NFXL1 [Trichuris trichiura]|uniref:NF X1 type zinc finger protein NFXL1 n=1 Tax=Trichuris trichiura TaxID=36087 RepID=A0A077Z9F4_TRITR|nr:NF X1 type zinc finger protein NFXL1 [Trichuris trichiura]
MDRPKCSAESKANGGCSIEGDGFCVDASENESLSGSPLSQWMDVAKNVGESLTEKLLDVDSGCLVCLEAIDRPQAIWSCTLCYCSYHLVCIQRWANQSIEAVRQKIAERSTYEDRNDETIGWCCPKCRRFYDEKEYPKEYRCYCGKVQNPLDDPWNPAHSCGQKCQRQLSCGHKCLLLCHSGPCPPCPITVSVSCRCGQQPKQPRRCAHKEWSCDLICKKLLPCQVHRCTVTCHGGICPPCKELVQASCCCGNKKETRYCSEREWKCGTKCNRLLSCGKHFCAEVCHSGACHPCASGELFCPCGAVRIGEVTCILQISCCGGTCNALLSCAYHRCCERCHQGPCPPCRQLRLKRCRCGLKEKEVQCESEFLCLSKCRKMRACGRHVCNRRCCDSQCPPCEKLCERLLPCKVPCGREKTINPPKCTLNCSFLPACDHEEPLPHPCHYGKCPACMLPCNKPLPCGHRCLAKCHTIVRIVDIPTWPPSKQKLPSSRERKPLSMECPPCYTMVMVSCLGGHEKTEMPCHLALPYECGRTCGQTLACGNHVCQKLCHDIEHEDCEQCLERCQLIRPPGCPHTCTLACHPAPCPPCNLMVSRRCHCGLSQVYGQCSAWRHSEQEELKKMLSCGNKCPKQLICGHQCAYNCHDGMCSDPMQCSKKVTVRCPCLKRTAKIACYRKKDGLKCDDRCKGNEIELAPANIYHSMPCDSTCQGSGEMPDKYCRTQQAQETNVFLKLDRLNPTYAALMGALVCAFVAIAVFLFWS